MNHSVSIIISGKDEMKLGNIQIQKKYFKDFHGKTFHAIIIFHAAFFLVLELLLTQTQEFFFKISYNPCLRTRTY